jgi:hypothetical protein
LDESPIDPTCLPGNLQPKKMNIDSAQNLFQIAAVFDADRKLTPRDYGNGQRRRPIPGNELGRGSAAILLAFSKQIDPERGVREHYLFFVASGFVPAQLFDQIEVENRAIDLVQGSFQISKCVDRRADLAFNYFAVAFTFAAIRVESGDGASVQVYVFAHACSMHAVMKLATKLRDV